MINPYSKINEARNLTHGSNIDYRGNEQTSINTNNPPKQANEQGWLVRGLATVGDFVTNIVQGAVKSIEGIVDAGAMIGGLFGADVDEFVSYDFTSDIFGADEEGEGLLDWSWGKALSDVSYLEDDSMVNQIAEGVGGMLPAIAVNFIPGVGQALSTAMFIGGAGGNASEQALQEGATYGQALGYGATAGVIEGATEMIGGRAIGKATELTDTALGKLLIRKGLDKGVSKGAGKLAYTFVSEGVEEVLSDIADPINKRVWGVSDTFEMPTLKDLGKTFLVGGSVGAVLDGVGKGASAIRNRSKGGKSFVKVADNLEDISNTTKALAYLQQTNGVSQERFDSATVRSSERMMDSIENISEELQSMTEEQRKSAFETLRESTSFVDDTFNSDGTIKEEVKDSYADVMNFGAKYNVSSNLVYRGKEIENDIKAVNEQKDVNLELSDSKFTENQRKSFAKINRSLAKLNSKVGEKLSIIAIKDNADKVNAFIDGNNIYINEKYLEDGKWARYLSHEVSHFAKKSKEFNDFAKYITKYTEEDKLTKFVLQIDENYKYNLTLDGAKEIIGKVQKGEQVSKKESDFYDELVAHITEDLFTNEESINALVKDNSGLAKKILNRIKQFLQIFKGTNADTQTVVDLRKAEMLFEKALSSIGKENEELNERYEKGVAEYKKAKETYNKLPENQREKWLKENDWEAKDFADDVMGYDEITELEENGIGYDDKSKTAFSIRYAPIGEKVLTVGKNNFDFDGIVTLVANATERSYEDAKKWVESEISIANIIMNNPEYLDFEPDTRYDAIKKNSDYPQGTVDLSNLCPKRTEFTSMFDLLQKQYPNKLFTASDVAEMRRILKNNGITVACGACFVEDRRQLLGEIADTFIGMWKEAVDSGEGLKKINAEGKSIELYVTNALAKKYNIQKGSKILAKDTYIPTQYDLTTYEGFRLLEKNHPTIAMAFTRYNNSRGQQSGRFVEGRAEYDRQILGWSDAKVRSVNNNGGLRIFSFSDFEAVHLLDIIQVIIDCSAKGVMIQGYTKIPAFAKLVRNTGIKINRSLIPKGETGIKIVNGKKVLDIDTVEGIDINDKDYLDERDNPNVGNIIIGINPEQIGIAMLDDSIDYIIPFHSNKADAILKKLGLGAWENYKEVQHEKDILTGKSSAKNVNIYTQVINKYNPKNKVEFVNAFLKECKAQGKVPRYSDFLGKDKNGDFVYREGYHKLLVDFKMFDKDGNILPQSKVVPELDNEFMAEILNAEVDKKKSYKFPEEVYQEIENKFGKNDKKGARLSKGSSEDLPDFNTVASLDKWFDSLSFEELQELVNDIEQDIKDVVVETLPISKQERREQFVKRLYEQGKLNQVVTKIVKSKPQMQQYFSDTKMNNKYNPLIPSKTDEYVVMFHGTPEQFNVFDTKKVGKHGSVMGSGLYFTNNYSYAEDYKEYDDGRVIATLLDIKKPLSRNRHEITREELKTFIKKVVDSNGEDFLSNYGDVYSVGYDKLLNDTVNKLFEYNTNDVDMIEDIYITSRMDFDDFHDGLTDVLGYDGVIAWNKAEGTQAIVFRSNQVKEIFNFKPTKNQDIRLSKGSNDGLYQKKIADISKKKVYAKKEAQEVINTVIGSIDLGNGYYVDVTTKKSVEGVIDELWKVMNTNDAGKRVKASEDIADYLIDTLVIKDMFENEDHSEEINTISAIRPYLHNIDLSTIKDEIKYRFDKDNSVYAIWGAKKGEKGKSADQIAMELEESGIYIKAENQAEIFFEIDRMYRDALKTINEKKVDYLKDNLNEEDRKQLRTKIRNEILRSFDEYGSKSKFTKVIEEQSVWRELYYRERAVKNLLDEVGKLKDVKEYQSASEFNNEQFKGSIEKLGKLNWRGNLNESGARKIASTLLGWYNEDNAIIGKRFDEEVYNTLEEISKGNGKLVSNEIRNLSNVVAYFRKFLETYSKVYREDKWVEAKPLVEDYVKKLEDGKNIKVGWLSTMAGKVFNNKKWSYAEAFDDPMTLARYMDKYGDGFFTQMMENLREGAVKSAIEEMELNAPIEEFSQEHKKYFKELSKRTVMYQGVEMTMDKAISLYMTLNRGHALLGLARSGFAFENEDGKIVRVDGFATDETLTFDEIQQRAFGVQEELGRQFNDIDFEYIEILEDIFNVKAKKLKAERDREMRGYTNVTDDYYFPIIRSNIAKGIESLPNFITDSISNASFNKNIVKGTQSELFINSIDLITEKHIKGIAQYYHLAQAIQTYDVLFNLDISGNKNKPITVKTESANVWKNGEQYFKTMLEDIQGKKKGDSGLYSFIRKGFAKFQLGANPKVWFTQLSSFFASTSILDYRSVVKGMAIKTDDVDKYCKLALLRNTDNTVAKAQGLIEEVGKVGDFLMTPIGKVDRLVIKKLFGACQVQVQKDNGLKIGTEENKVKAGELLQKVILETQQNSMATEKSQAMRSSSEMMKTLTMFTSDAMKVVGRVIDSYGKISVIKARIRMTTDSKALESLNKQLKSARKQAVKSTGALVTQAFFMALIAEAFKYFYNRDEEDEQVVEEILVDTVGNLFGGLPILKDVLGKLTEGYDFDSFAFSSINDLLESVDSLVTLVSDGISGEIDSRDVASHIRKISYAIGQIFGIPVRNIYNVFYGTSNIVSPSFAYKLSDTFSKQKYSSDLKRAIAREDDQMIATIVGLMTDENVGYFENSSTRQEINRLVKADFDVLPQSIANTMTINETQYTLTETQKDDFREVYEKSITAIDKLVSSNGYKIVSDDVKAKAIKYVYRYYYYESQSETLNVELDNKLFLFGQLIPIDKMALILAEAPSIAEKSTDKKKAVQRYLQSTKLSAIQKYMLMGYFGYKNTNSESAVKSAIDKTSLTKAQKKLLLEKCGY